jgi:predicted dehydrogenase
VQVTPRIEDALQNPAVDAVVVCAEATAHYHICKLCLQHGKHVLVEKPITTKSDDAEGLIELSQALGLTLMVGHTFLYNPGIAKVKEYLRRGKVGRVYYIYTRRTNLGPIRKDVNALWDLAPHDIAICNHLLEATPQWASAVGAKVLRSRQEDVGFISLGYPEGVVAHVHVSWADPNKAREVVVVGSESRIVFNDLNGVEQVRVFEKGVALEAEPTSYGEYRFCIRDGDIMSPHVEISEPLKNQCKHFIECVAERGRPLSGGPEGRDVVRVLEGLDISLRNNGAPVQLWSDKKYEFEEKQAAATVR